MACVKIGKYSSISERIIAYWKIIDHINELITFAFRFYSTELPLEMIYDGNFSNSLKQQICISILLVTQVKPALGSCLSTYILTNCRCDNQGAELCSIQKTVHVSTRKNVFSIPPPIAVKTFCCLGMIANHGENYFCF